MTPEQYDLYQAAMQFGRSAFTLLVGVVVGLSLAILTNKKDR